MLGVIEGKRYNRSVRFHKLLYEAMIRLAWKDFPTWLEMNGYSEDNHHVECLMKELLEMVQHLGQDTFSAVAEHRSFLKVAEMFERYLD